MGLRKNMLTPRTQSPDAGRGADAVRKGPIGLGQVKVKARYGWIWKTRVCSRKGR